MDGHRIIPYRDALEFGNDRILDLLMFVVTDPDDEWLTLAAVKFCG